MNKLMFCFQCQETAKGTGCTIRGVCGKEPTTSAMMDILLYSVRGVSIVSHLLRQNHVKVFSKSNRYILDALFTTITNANFDEKAIINKIEYMFQLRNLLIRNAQQNKIDLPEIDELDWNSEQQDYFEKAKEIGVLREENQDIRSLKEMITYGLKGIAAYLEHAHNLDYQDESIDVFIQDTFYKMTVENLSVETLTEMVLQTGSMGVKAMALLDKANTETYGNPEITQVDFSAGKNPGILISGHDLRDMKMLLEQTKGTGVDVYTHSEMLPANYYPEFEKYDNFHGNYGNAWWKQNEEFEKFNGPILMTTNCIVPPKKNNTYLDRMFTTSNAGFPGANHIEADEEGYKDFSEIIEMAKKCQAPENLEDIKVVGGFAHNQVLALADKVINEVNEGNIRKFVVMAGCDGRSTKRNYYTDFAQALPKDTVILTAGCAKYRYNKLGLGDIHGIPRVLYAGQCNDSYSLVQVALSLKQAFNLDDVNQLPIVYNIAWYEQKAVIVLLALLSLGVKNIHLGPTLPAFLSPNVVDVLVKNFGIGSITDVDSDLVTMGLTK